VSEDIDELFVICDRITALYEGAISPIVKTSDTDIEQVGQWIAGSFNVQAKNSAKEPAHA
jgi:simple sugar transport system ATP-binding protein